MYMTSSLTGRPQAPESCACHCNARFCGGTDLLHKKLCGSTCPSRFHCLYRLETRLLLGSLFVHSFSLYIATTFYQSIYQSVYPSTHPSNLGIVVGLVLFLVLLVVTVAVVGYVIHKRRNHLFWARITMYKMVVMFFLHVVRLQHVCTVVKVEWIAIAA